MCFFSFPSGHPTTAVGIVGQTYRANTFTHLVNFSGRILHIRTAQAGGFIFEIEKCESEARNQTA